MRQIFTTYSTVTEESSAIGDTADCGWYDEGFRYPPMEKPESGFSCEPDESDIEDNYSAVDLAVDFLERNGADEASASYYHPNVWYSTESRTEDYSSDESISYNFHLEGFSDEEQKEIYKRVIGK